MSIRLLRLGVAFVLTGCTLTCAGQNTWHEYQGVIHVHSIYSDGSGTIEHIAEEAAKVGVDFVIMSDHSTLRPLYEGKQRWYGNVLMLIGTELDRKEGHFLALNVRHVPDRKTDIQTAINEVNADGGFVIIAHPHSVTHPWLNWGLSGITGMEIVSLGAMLEPYREEIQNRAIRGIFTLTSLSFIDWIRPFVEPRPDAALSKWDEMTQTKRFVGIGSLDTHARAYCGKIVINFPHYHTEFNVIRTHIFTREKFNGDITHDALLVYDALRAGHCAIVYRLAADSAGFTFTAKGDETEAIMGDEVTLQNGLVLKAHAPIRATGQRLVLVKDGTTIVTRINSSLWFPVKERGVYRVEAYVPVSLGWFQKPVLATWILSNPIYVK